MTTNSRSAHGRPNLDVRTIMCGMAWHNQIQTNYKDRAPADVLQSPNSNGLTTRSQLFAFCSPLKPGVRPWEYLRPIPAQPNDWHGLANSNNIQIIDH